MHLAIDFPGVSLLAFNVTCYAHYYDISYMKDLLFFMFMNMAHISLSFS